jgi:type II secretory ATPase GspE/PulE/Tfp pilus assembly ATPase PilB-like protein
MVISDAIRAQLLGSASASDIKMQALAEGMTTMRHNGMIKARDGITTLAEVLRTAFAIG